MKNRFSNKLSNLKSKIVARKQSNVESIMFLMLTAFTLITGVITLRLMGMYQETIILDNWIKLNSIALILSGVFALGYPTRIFKSQFLINKKEKNTELILGNYNRLCLLTTIITILLLIVGHRKTEVVALCLSAVYGIQLSLTNVYSSYESAINKKKMLILRNLFAGTILPVMAVIASVLQKNLTIYFFVCSLGMTILNISLAMKHSRTKLSDIKFSETLKDIPKSLPFFTADLGMSYILPFAVLLVSLLSLENDLSSIYPLVVIMSFPVLILRSLEIPWQRVFIDKFDRNLRPPFRMYFMIIIILQVVTLMVSAAGYSFLAPKGEYGEVASIRNLLVLTLYVFLMSAVQFGKLSLIARDRLLQLAIIWPASYLIAGLSIMATSQFVNYSLVDVLLILATMAFLFTILERRVKNFADFGKAGMIIKSIGGE